MRFQREYFLLKEKSSLILKKWLNSQFNFCSWWNCVGFPAVFFFACKFFADMGPVSPSSFGALDFFFLNQKQISFNAL